MKTKFGIVGTGTIAAFHAKAIRSLPRACLYGAADADELRAEQFAKEHICRAYPDFDAMLSDPELDAVCICTPSGLHPEQAARALRAGKHVVLEKPMALDTASAAMLAEEAEESGSRLTVVSQLRFTDSARYARQLLSEDAFGRLSMVCLSMNYWRSPEYYAANPWRGTRRFDGGGALMNQGIHGIDLLQFLLGPARVISASANTVTHKIEVEDTLCALVSFDCGAMGTITASTCAYPGFDRRLEIFGDRGHLVMRESEIEELIIDGNEVSCQNTEPKTSSAGNPTQIPWELHARQIDNLIDAVRTGTSLVSTARDGLLAVQMIESIYRAAGQSHSPSGGN
ncbi:MAG: Gfo/Idh/MocA family oxidoreductase [Clostridia bacterium]|nr:Gfo/Idh/MocA family oxidoreductase [Clostridia bacterium]